MATVQLDNITGPYSVVEEFGIVRSFTRNALIEGITQSGGVTFQSESFAALDAAGLTWYSTTSVDSNLVLARRTLQPYSENDNTKAIAVLEYMARGELPGEIGTWIPQVSASLNQREKATDVIGAAITTSHTFPDTDDSPNAGVTVRQGGKVQQLVPAWDLMYRGLVQPPSILKLTEKYLGRTNSTTWNYLSAGKWLCSDFNASVVDVQSGLDTWLVDVTFQARLDGWAETVVFTDPDTGQQPPDLVAGVGFKNVQVQPQVDFNDLIAGV